MKLSVPNIVYQPDAKIYRPVEYQVGLLPQGLPSDSCSNCKHVFFPEYLEKREALTAVTAHNGVVWQRQSLFLDCPNCGAGVEHRLPIIPQKARYGFFGDEAMRETEEFCFVTYSLVGANHVHLQNFEQEVNALKLKWAPGLAPREWAIHMTELQSSEKRAKHPVFAKWEHRQCEAFRKDLLAVVAGFDGSFLKINSSAIARKPKSKNDILKLNTYLKKEVFAGLLLETITMCTSQGVCPYFYFDAEKVAKTEPNVHQWARDVYLGSHQNLLYAHISHGISVPEPEFVRPASRPLLEIADVVCFVTARHVHRKLKKAQIDSDPKALGGMKYIVFNRRGDMVSTDLQHRGYPWDLF